MSSAASAANFKEALRRHLDASSSRLPNEIIESWQADNSIRLPSLDAALPLLDRVRVRRYEFYQSTADLLRERLLTRVRELAATGRRSSYKRMAELLEASFPYLSVPALRPVPMTLLEHLTTLLDMHKPAVRPRLKDKYLKAIAGSPELYSAAPVAVKRLIWEGDPKLFVSEVSPLLDELVRARSAAALCLADIEQPLLTLPSKARRQLPVMQRLLQLIGTSSFLYEQTVACLREKYKCTGAPEVCSLRMDLLMSLHDAKIDDVCVRDPLHKFAWVLDACGRDRVADTRRLTELRGFYKAAKSAATDSEGHSGGGVMAEVSLLCACPHVQATLALCLLSRLDQLVLAAQLPRSDATCRFLVRLLQLGLSAWELVRQDDDQPQHSGAGWLSESVAACELLPSVARLRLETQLRLVARQTRRLMPASVQAAAQQQQQQQTEQQDSSSRRQKSGKSKKQKQQQQEQQQQPSLVLPPSEDAPRPPALPLVCAGSRIGRLLARYHCVHVARELKRTAPDILQVSCDLLLDLLDSLAPLDEEFEPMALQYLAVQLCQLKESARPAAAKPSVSSAAAIAGSATASVSADDDKLIGAASQEAAIAPVIVVGAGDEAADDFDVGIGGGVNGGGGARDAESCRQIDRVLQRLCSKLLAPRAAKQPLAAALLAHCCHNLPPEDRPATTPTTPGIAGGATPFWNRARSVAGGTGSR